MCSALCSRYGLPSFLLASRFVIVAVFAVVAVAALAAVAGAVVVAAVAVAIVCFCCSFVFALFSFCVF